MKRQHLFRSATALTLSILMAASPILSAGPVFADTGTESVRAESTAPDEAQSMAMSITPEVEDTASVSEVEEEISSSDVTVTSDAGKLAEETTALDGDNRLIIKTDEDLTDVLTAGEAVQMDDVAVASFDSAEEKEEAKADLAEAGIDDVSEDETVSIQDGEDAAAGTVTNGTGRKVALIDTGVNGIETVDFTGECTADDNGHGTRMAQAIEKAAGGKADILSLKGLLESLPIAAAASHAAKSEAYFTDKSDFSEAKADYLDILNMVYPVGIYYRSAVNKSPAKFLGDMG